MVNEVSSGRAQNRAIYIGGAVALRAPSAQANGRKAARKEWSAPPLEAADAVAAALATAALAAAVAPAWLPEAAVCTKKIIVTIFQKMLLGSTLERSIAASVLIPGTG